jgi:hypothetical protein
MLRWQIDCNIASPDHLSRKYELQKNDEEVEFDDGPITLQERYVPSPISNEIWRVDKSGVDPVTHFFSVMRDLVLTHPTSRRALGLRFC